MTTRNTVKKVAAALGGVALLAGVGAGGYFAGRADAPDADGQLGAIDVVATAAPADPEPMNPAAEGSVAGDSLGFDPGTLPDGLLSYLTLDGQYVVLDPAQELPAEVLADLPDAAVAVMPDGDVSPGARAVMLEQYADTVLAGTGHNVVVVFETEAQVSADVSDIETGWVFWARDSEGSYQSALGDDLEETKVAAQEWADAHDQGRFTVVVLP